MSIDVGQLHSFIFSSLENISNLKSEVLKQEETIYSFVFLCLGMEDGAEDFQNHSSYLYWMDRDLSKHVLRFYKERAKRKFIPTPEENEFICTKCDDCYKKLVTSWSDSDKQVKIGKCQKCDEEEKQRRENRGKEYEERKVRETEERRRLKTMPYDDYLQTEHWQLIRKQALKRSNFRCQLCNAGNKQLHVHHRTYERLGCELWNDVITLCKDCHEKHHNIEQEESDNVE